jgi:Mycobacterial 4 TMS phage holin, superfamily IV
MYPMKCYKGGILMGQSDNIKENNNGSILGWIGRLIIVAIVLGLTSFLTPGFSINGLWSYLLAAVVITVLDYLVESFMGVDASPFGKGVKGFVIAAIILYVAQFLVPNMRVSIWGAIIAALVIGVLDAIFPKRVM